MPTKSTNTSRFLLTACRCERCLHSIAGASQIVECRLSNEHRVGVSRHIVRTPCDERGRDQSPLFMHVSRMPKPNLPATT